jgi:hypothetical protein
MAWTLQIADQNGNFSEAGQRGGSQAALTGHEDVPALQAPDDEWGQDAVVANRLRERREVGGVKPFARLVRICPNLVDRHKPHERSIFARDSSSPER